MAVTTLGRLMVRNALPLDFKDRASAVWDKNDILQITTLLAKEDPDGYIDILSKLNSIGLYVISTYGALAGLTLKDVDSSKSVKGYVAKFQLLINNILNDLKLTNLQKLLRITLLGYKYSGKIKDTIVLDHKNRRTALYAQMKAGARGNPMQMTQLNFGDLGVRDALNRDIPYFSCTPRSNGASPFSMWVGASSSRKGFYDVQALTGRAGYLGKQASNATHSTPIVLLDCGTTDTGIAVPADNDCVGSVLLRPFKGHPAGAVVTLDMLALCGDNDKLIVRSPTTCKSAYGVCAHCSGIDLNDKFPAIGLYVALNAAKTFVLKATQAGVGSKHTGGTGGKRVLDLDGDDQPTGMDALLRIFFVPSTFPGGAVLSTVDGTVNRITEAPQGGHYITVGTTTTYAPQIRKLRVNVGDTVTAGDKLTNGVPNPVLVVQHKGLGQGRQYFIQQLNKTLKSNGWGVNKRNLLQFSRSFLNKVRITDPDGYNSYLPGDVVDYSIVQASWEPRLGAIITEPLKATGMYLLKPVLHYTIGTRVTPLIANTLKLNGFNEVTAHKLQPPFLSLFIRSQSIVYNDKNWLPRLMGLRLRPALFLAAQQGITDRYDSPSYVDKVIASPYKPKG